MKLFFDLDGPILDVSERYFRVYCESLKKISHTPESKANYWSMKRQKVPDAAILGSSIDRDSVNRYISDRKKMIEDPAFLRYDNVWTELYPTYQRVFCKIPTVLVTLRNNPENLSKQLRDLNIDTWFEQILSYPRWEKSEDLWKIKVQLILESGSLQDFFPEDCLFVGDTETDILAGKKLGMQTVAVGFGIRTRGILEKYQPDLLFDTPSEFEMFLLEQYL